MLLDSESDHHDDSHGAPGRRPAAGTRDSARQTQKPRKRPSRLASEKVVRGSAMDSAGSAADGHVRPPLPPATGAELRDRRPRLRLPH
jgi:hypothetical protein